MKKLILVLAFLTFSLGFSQTEKISKLDIANSIKTAFNNANYQVLYSYFSEEYKNTKSLEQATAFFTRLKNANGKITELKASYSDKGFSKFPITFTNKKNLLVIKYDANNKIDYLSINKPE